MLRQFLPWFAPAVMCALTLTSLPTLAAGGFVGGGGKGVMCDGKVQVLEIYEAELRGQKILPAPPDLDSNLERLGLALSDMMRTNRFQWPPGELIKYVHAQFAGRTIYINPEKTLPVTEDATLPPMRAGCSVVQIALWSKDNWIYFDKNLWDKLDPLNQAVIMAHELVYAIAREKGVTNSDESRDLIRMVLTDPNPPGQVTPALARPEFGSCHGEASETGEELSFYVIDETKDGKAGLGFYFITLKNEGRFVRTYGFLPDAKLSELLRGRLPSSVASFGVENITETQRWKLDLKTAGRGLAARASFYNQTKPAYTPIKCEMRQDGRYLEDTPTAAN